MYYNSAADLQDFFSTPEHRVSIQEFMEFWRSLSDEEKEYYRKAELLPMIEVEITLNVVEEG